MKDFKKFAACPSSPNCVSSKAEGDHFIEPLKTNGDAQSSFKKLRDYLKEQKRVDFVTEEQNYIHTVFTTAIMRFKDDVEFELEGDVIHVRSASRLGYSDLGANRKRVEKIRAELKK